LSILLKEYPVIYTERLILRPYKYKDLDDLYEIFSSKLVMKYIHPYHKDKKVTESYLKERIENKYKGYIEEFALENEDNKVVGIVKLDFNKKLNSCELSFILNNNYWYMGYAYESCLKILYYCFCDLNLDSVTARVDSRNFRSLRLLGRLFFDYDYSSNLLFNRILYYKITKEEFKMKIEIK